MSLRGNKFRFNMGEWRVYVTLKPVSHQSVSEVSDRGGEKASLYKFSSDFS